jgi:S-formylglutathione hydrolase FrmB
MRAMTLGSKNTRWAAPVSVETWQGRVKLSTFLRNRAAFQLHSSHNASCILSTNWSTISQCSQTTYPPAKIYAVPSQKAALAEFQQHGFEPVFKTFPGDHEWKVFRNSLIDLAPMLFK